MMRLGRHSFCTVAFLTGFFLFATSARASVPQLETVRVQNHFSSDEKLTLRVKRFARPGAIPLLMIHGLAENDRLWDALPETQSMARFFYEQGFDVWIGNLRASGTEGYRSDSPVGLAKRWTVEDYAVFDIPALVARVREDSHQKPWIIAHSMGAWALEGALSGLRFNAKGRLITDDTEARFFRNSIRGIISIAGVYNLWWTHSLQNASIDPLLSKDDFYRSNYELEALARTEILYPIVHRMNAIPFSWVKNALTLPVQDIPWVGHQLSKLYQSLQGSIIESPLLNMFLYTSNVLPETVQAHGKDGLEDLGAGLLEQVANAVIQRKTLSYYKGEPSSSVYQYSEVRSQIRLPLLMIAGSKDRLAHAAMIYQDGFLGTYSPFRKYIEVEAGHLDIINGIQARTTVWKPALEWIKNYTPE